MNETNSAVFPTYPTTVTIMQVSNGFVVSMGGQQYVYETQDKMISEINRYLNDHVRVQ